MMLSKVPPPDDDDSLSESSNEKHGAAEETDAATGEIERLMALQASTTDRDRVLGEVERHLKRYGTHVLIACMGSGKSYASRGLIEQVVRCGGRVLIPTYRRTLSNDLAANLQGLGDTVVHYNNGACPYTP